MTRPLRSTPTAPSRDFAAITSRSASVARIGARSLAGSARLGGSLSPPQPAGSQYPTTPSHVPCETSRSGSRRLTCRAPPGNTRAPARLIPGCSVHARVLVPPHQITTLQQRSRLRDCATSSWSPPDASRAPFPVSLTTTVVSQRSTRWFGAPPRRAAPKGQNLHLSHSAASRNLAYMFTLLSTFVAHPEV